MNSPQDNSPWGIPHGESDSLPQANLGIHEECPGNQIHGEFPMGNSSREIRFTVGNSSDSSWRIWGCNIKMLQSMYERRVIVNLKQTQRLVPLSGCHGLLSYDIVTVTSTFFSIFVCRCHYAI